MKKFFIVLTLSVLTQEAQASFAQQTNNPSTATAIPWKRINQESNRARQQVFAALQANGHYRDLEELQQALAKLDEEFSNAFRNRLNTGDEDTYQEQKAGIKQREQALLDLAETIIETHVENPPAYEEPRSPDYERGSWDDTPTYEEEDWSDETGWVKVGDEDLTGFYDSPEYERSLQQVSQDNDDDYNSDSE